MPIWKDLAPRFGVVYDLFGNAKTALKFGFNRYNESRTTFFANRYNPLRGAQPAADLDRPEPRRHRAGGARAASIQTPGCEINFATLPANFGSRR